MEREIIINKLDAMNKNLEFIKEHIEDAILSKDDLDSLKDAETDLAEGRTKRLN